MSAKPSAKTTAKSAKAVLRKVVIIDDDRFIREILHLILRHENFEIVGGADDGERGLRLVERFHPDILFLDINMPGMDGLQVLNIMQENHPDTKVVMISGAATVDKVKTAISSGAVGFVVKPFSPEAVISTLQRAKLMA